LVGQLHSNEAVVLGDVRLSEWFHDQFSARSRWAVVGLFVDGAPGGRWERVEVQTTGLETVLGNAIAATWWPANEDVEPQRFSADVNRAACFESLARGVSVTARYEETFSVGDRYGFHLSNFGRVTLIAESPLTVDEWIRSWIDPLIGLMTLATGEREEINRVTLVTPHPRRAEEPRAYGDIRGELWGGGIHQRDQPAALRTRADGSLLIPLFTLDNAPPLAELLQTWRTTLAEQSATSLYRLAIDPTLPIQVRFLLCAQALEALDTTARVKKEEAEDTSHAKRRAAIVKAVKAVSNEHLDTSTKRFIHKHLARQPFRSLAQRLLRHLAQVPEHDARTDAWVKQTEPLAAELASLRRPSHPLHERLASTRNALSHGSVVSAEALQPAVRILESLLRGQLLIRLGLDERQLRTAFDRMAAPR
ncbi:MAG: HEPN domain-containing protein, partial [Acidimicrobiales bacterium]